MVTKKSIRGCIEIVSKMNTKKEKYWIATRNNQIQRIFRNRKEAVKWLKDLLKQTLEDFENQDKTDEFDYPISIKEIHIGEYDTRNPSLGM